MKIKENRSLLVVILLTIITFGFYSLFLVYELARDTNIACKEDGKNTPGLLGYIILTIITFGIYSFIWWVLVIERWDVYLRKHNAPVRITGLGYFLWSFFGSMIIIGPFVALYLAIHTMNDVAMINNKA